MANNKNRKLRGAILTGALVAPAVMSAAQQNAVSSVSTDLSGWFSSAKELSSWAISGAKQGIEAAWSSTYGKVGLCFLGVFGIVFLRYFVKFVARKTRYYLWKREVDRKNTELENFDLNELKKSLDQSNIDETLKGSLKKLSEYLGDVPVKCCFIVKSKDQSIKRTEIVDTEKCYNILKKTLVDNRERDGSINFKGKNFEEIFTENLRGSFERFYEVDNPNSPIKSTDTIVGFSIISRKNPKEAGQIQADNNKKEENFYFSKKYEDSYKSVILQEEKLDDDFQDE